MNDLTNLLAEYKTKAEADKTRQRIKTIGVIETGLEYIKLRSKELDMLIDNAYSAVDAGIKLYTGTYIDSQDDFERGNFEANGIRHRLGFITKRDEFGTEIPYGLAVIGGGCNGDVSIIYLEDGFVAYDKEDTAHCGRNIGDFMRDNPLEEMSDSLLHHYEYAVKTFVRDIDSFSEHFENYLLRKIAREK